MSMMPYVSLQVQGTQQLADDFGMLERKDGKVYARKAMKLGAVPIMAAAAASAVYEDRTGLLRMSARAVPGKGDREGRTSILIRWTATVGAFIQHLKEKGFSEKKLADVQRLLIYKYLGNIGARYDVFYARMVEFGHQASGWYANIPGAQFVKAHPFARPAFDATVDTAADIIEESLAAQIESA
jgi:HK97 gp10 family phage protein